MSTYITEDEQLELIKKWWKRHGNLASLLISLIVFGIAGYKYKIWHQEKIAGQASIAYEQMMVAVSNHDGSGVERYANELFHTNSKSVYADVAHMTLAKVYVSMNKLDEAQIHLETVEKNTKLTFLKQIAKMRLTRVQLQKKSNEVFKILQSTIEDPTYRPVLNELKGDIFTAAGALPEALDAYNKALIEFKNNDINNSFLEMKADEITANINKNKKAQTA